MANSSKAKGIMYSVTRDKSPFIGNQHFFVMKISPDSPKTAGEIVLTFGNESVSVTK